MDPNDLLREAIVASIKEGVKAGFNFLSTKFGKSDDPDVTSVSTESMPESPPDPDPSSFEESTDLDWTKAATLFWLGNDLMWIQDQMYRGSVPSRVLQGVEHALIYARRLGFGDKSLPIQNLGMAKTILEALPDHADTEQAVRVIQQHYGIVEQYIKQTKFYVQARAEGQEPDFEKLRVL